MSQSAIDEFAPLIIEMLQNPPNDPLPLTNRRYGAMSLTIPFHVLSWIAVAFRLHTRLRIVRDPGIDDFFVVLAALFNLAFLVGFLGGFTAGFGQHIVYVIMNAQQDILIWFYVANAAYSTTAVCIKLSLVFQYLRLFQDGYRRIITKILLVVVAVWGLGFCFTVWFPCFPVHGFWNRRIPATCYGFGYRSTTEMKYTLIAFTASNMTLDIVILLVPLTEYFKPGLGRNQVMAMTGLFTMGSIVVGMAALRLWSGLKNSHLSATMFDFTWWAPEVFIFSSLEIDFAIMCASMPIFWPTVVASWNGIFITNEVILTNDRRSRLHMNNNRQLFEMRGSVSRMSTSSTDGLTKANNSEAKVFRTDYEEETWRDPSHGFTQVEVRAQRKPSS